MLHLKTVYHFPHVRQKLTMCLLMKQIIFTLKSEWDPMSNRIEFKDNYSDTLESLWQFKRDEGPNNNDDLTIDHSQSFKYNAALVGRTAYVVNANSSVKKTKIVVPLRYLSNFWRALEMPLINHKIHVNYTGLKTGVYQLLEILQNLK